MVKSLPHYYSRLKPFRQFLARGGILTYHHVGPRPQVARLKGLYVSPKLFTQQMTELRTEGFTGERFSKIALDASPERRHIFITFDDGFRDVAQHAMPVLGSCNFRAIQFLVADLIGQTSVWQEESGETPGPLMDKAEIQAWLAAGHEIGSHTRRHPFLTRVSEADAREEITASKKKLEDMFGASIDHFCYPYGDHNPVVRDLVEQSGYKTACTTMFGINDATSDPFLLKRITARYPSRNWKGLKSWLGDKFLPIVSAA